MTFEIWLLCVLIGGMGVCFFMSWAPVDLIVFAGLSLAVLFGLIRPDQAFTGFSSPVVITTISMFFLSGALRESGVSDWLGKQIYKVAGDSERKTILLVVVMGALLSSFMINVAAVALLLPTVVSLALRANVAPSRLLIPLCFGVILGGTTTLIGTTPNLLVAEVLSQLKLKPFGFLDFTPIGLACLFGGTVVMVWLAPRLLPVHEGQRKGKSASDLARMYELFESIFRVAIPEGSGLVGKSLKQLPFGEILGSQVISIVKKGDRHFAPTSDFVVEAGDILALGGKKKELEAFKSLHAAVVESSSEELLSPESEEFKGAVLLFVGKRERRVTIADLNIHRSYGVLVVGIERDGEVLYRNLGQEFIRPYDKIHVVGPAEAMVAMVDAGEYKLLREKSARDEVLNDHLFLMRIPKTETARPITLADSHLGELLGITVVGIVREGACLLAVGGGAEIHPGDCLLAIGEPSQVEKLKLLGGLHILPEACEFQLESPEVGMLEVVLSPRSKLEGSTLAELHFRERYGFQVLSLWRDGKPFLSRIGQTKLRFGDGLLVQGPRVRGEMLASDPDFVVVSEVERVQRRKGKAPFVVLAVVLAIFLPAFRLLPVEMAAFLAAVFALVTGCVGMQDAYREVNWRSVFFVAALLPFGYAVEQSGASILLVQTLKGALGEMGPLMVLGILAILSSTISQVLDSTLAVILLTPIAVQMAHQLGVSPYSYAMMVAMSASVAFMSPVSHKANLLVMGPGGYRPRDFFCLGTVLSIVVIAILMVTVPVFFPLMR